jgi:hypothetical protein
MELEPDAPATIISIQGRTSRGPLDVWCGAKYPVAAPPQAAAFREPGSQTLKRR